MNIMTVNAGSSSVRLAAFKNNNDGFEKLACKRYLMDESSPSILKTFQKEHNINEFSVIAHRIVHGGSSLVNSCLINSNVEREIEHLSILAPLHNPFTLKWIGICREVFGDEIPQVAVFDTSYFAQLPEVATIYALPKDLCKEFGIRRYGFHGLAHRSMWESWKRYQSDLINGGKVISLQLGSGCSITAVNNGKVMDTSMGFSPLEGLVMATRPGDIDPGLITFFEKTCKLKYEEIEKMLNKFSGILGVSGISSNMHALLETDHPDARLGIDLFCYRAIKYLYSYYGILKGADAIIFGGGVGENAPIIRKRIIDELAWLGIFLDNEVNNSVIGKECCISTKDSRTSVCVFPVDEATVIAREAIEVMKRNS